MRIGVATGAVQILPVIDHRFRLEFGRFLVAICARHRHVSARQQEVRFLVLGQGESGGFVRFQVVASVASVEVRCRRELIGVPITVTIRAAFELDLE